MKTVLRTILVITILSLGVLGCQTDVQKVKPEHLSKTDETRRSRHMMTFYENEHHVDADMSVYFRYHHTLVEPIELFHRAYGRLPSDLNEFFSSDICLVYPKEHKTGLQFIKADELDENHPEQLVYHLTDKDTAELKIILPTRQGDQYVHVHQWNKEKFLWFIPRDESGSTDEIFQEALKKDLPVGKKGKIMVDHLKKLTGLAIADYFDRYYSFPATFEDLFKDEWGQFRFEPWANFQYDDPIRKLPTNTFGFDHDNNVYYVQSIWENFEYETATRLPANYVEEPGRPLNMSKVANIDDLNIEFFVDIDSLIDMARQELFENTYIVTSHETNVAADNV